MSATTTPAIHKTCGDLLSQVLAAIPDDVNLFSVDLDLVSAVQPRIKVQCASLHDLNAVGDLLALDPPVTNDRTYGLEGYSRFTRVSHGATIRVEAIAYVAPETGRDDLVDVS